MCVQFNFSFTDALPDIIHNWTVQRQSEYGFSSVACDQTIEQTFNRESKTKGGVTEGWNGGRVKTKGGIVGFFHSPREL